MAVGEVSFARCFTTQTRGTATASLVDNLRRFAGAGPERLLRLSDIHLVFGAEKQFWAVLVLAVPVLAMGGTRISVQLAVLQTMLIERSFGPLHWAGIGLETRKRSKGCHLKGIVAEL